MNLLETQVAIKYLKDKFEELLAKKLNLTRVSAPLFVEESTGLNDNLNGYEESVSFFFKDKKLEIVHSLAKWKRYALKEYKFPVYSGLYRPRRTTSRGRTYIIFLIIKLARSIH